MNIESELNTKLNEIWLNHFGASSEVPVPLYFSKLKRECLLFIGCNPSFNRKAIKKFFESTSSVIIDPDTYFAWKNRNSFNSTLDAKMDVVARQNYPFFKQHKELAKKLNMEWEHIDLFQYRETSQKSLIALHEDLPSFEKAQLRIFQQALEHISPKVILIANAGAASIFIDKYKLEFDEKDGCYFLIINDRQVPVFLSGMLTGRRALDTYSRERLFWHINKIMSQL